MKYRLILLSLVLCSAFLAASSKKRKRRLLARAPPTCQPPVWNAKTVDNWILPGILPKSKPFFELKVKGLDAQGRYKPGKMHTVLVKVHPKRRKDKKVGITGFIASLEPLGDAKESCRDAVGSFRSSKRRGPKFAAPPAGCTRLLVLDIRHGKVKKGVGKWRAPICGNDVVMRVMVRGIDGRLYEDTNIKQEEYQLLTKTLRPPTS